VNGKILKVRTILEHFCQPVPLPKPIISQLKYNLHVSQIRKGVNLVIICAPLHVLQKQTLKINQKFGEKQKQKPTQFVFNIRDEPLGFIPVLWIETLHYEPKETACYKINKYLLSLICVSH